MELGAKDPRERGCGRSALVGICAVGRSAMARGCVEIADSSVRRPGQVSWGFEGGNRCWSRVWSILACDDVLLGIGRGKECQATFGAIVVRSEPSDYAG